MKEYFNKHLEKIEGYEFVKLINKNGKNINIFSTIEVKHECGYQFKIRLSNLKNRKKCPLCSVKNNGQAYLDDKLFKIKFSQREDSDDYVILGEFKDLKTPIDIYHKKCRKIKSVRPTELIHGKTKCICVYGKYSYSHTKEEMQQRISLKVDGYEILTETCNIRTIDKVEFLHIDCGRVFIETPENIIKKDVLCHHCYDKYANCVIPIKSKNWNVINDYIIYLEEEYEVEKTYDNLISPTSDKKLRYDFFIPKLNLLIEYHGRQHYTYSKSGIFTKEKYERAIERDMIKVKYAKDNNINLLVLNEEDMVNYLYRSKILSHYPQVIKVKIK